MYIVVQQRHPGYVYEPQHAAFVPTDDEEAPLLGRGTGYSLMQVGRVACGLLATARRMGVLLATAFLPHTCPRRWM